MFKTQMEQVIDESIRKELRQSATAILSNTNRKNNRRNTKSRKYPSK